MCKSVSYFGVAEWDALQTLFCVQVTGGTAPAFRSGTSIVMLVSTCGCRRITRVSVYTDVSLPPFINLRDICERAGTKLILKLPRRSGEKQALGTKVMNKY